MVESQQSPVFPLNSSGIVYTPANNFIGADSFTFILSDGQGGAIQVTLSVTVTDDSVAPASTSLAKLSIQPNGSIALTFAGIPGQTYNILRSTDLQNWTVIQTAVVPANGMLQWTDPSPPPSATFYRSVAP
jgi:hypothetical protein